MVQKLFAENLLTAVNSRHQGAYSRLMNASISRNIGLNNTFTSMFTDL
ncbi:MAG: hypothetical protein V7K39_18050 [Nostoc sp.]